MTNREAAIEWFSMLKEKFIKTEYEGYLDMAIAALEQKEQDRWHSVAKEGNPKESGLYIVTDKSKMDGNKPHTRWFNVRNDESFWSGWRADKVLAWRPLPEAYTEEES